MANEIELQTLRKKIVKMIRDTGKAEESAPKVEKAAAQILVERKEPAVVAPTLRRPDKTKSVAKTRNTHFQPPRTSNPRSDTPKKIKIEFLLKKNTKGSKESLHMAIRGANFTRKEAENVFSQSMPDISKSIKLSGCKMVSFKAAQSNLNTESIKKTCEAFHAYHQIRRSYTQNLNNLRPIPESFNPVTRKQLFMQSRKNGKIERNKLDNAFANLKKTSEETGIATRSYYQ